MFPDIGKHLPNLKLCDIFYTLGAVYDLMACLLYTFRKLHSSEHSQLVAGLSVNIICLLVVFLAGIERTENRIICQAVSILLHYFLLSTFCWMAALSYEIFRKVVVIWWTDIKYYLTKAIVFSQGNPIP